MYTLKEIVAHLSNAHAAEERRVYFIGIGGIGMSALARYFLSRGAVVSGYDRTETVLCKTLVEEGMHIHYTDDVQLADQKAALIIYTPAVPKDHKELQYFKENGYVVVKRSEVLGAITESSFNICVAGTHGKTTTSTMIAHILRDSGYGCNAFLGGIAANYNSNFWGSSRNVCVIEADEYDRSFLRLSPDMAVITSMDPDHLDIYGTAESVEEAFIEFSGRLKPGGTLLARYGLKREAELKATRCISYAAGDRTAQLHAEDIRMEKGICTFSVYLDGIIILKDLRLHMGGLHNIENMTAAAGMAFQLGIEQDLIRSAVASFRGVKRRFEYVIAPDEHPAGLVLIDDYAHHPQELNSLITGAKALFPGMKCTVIFQPHLFSRTADFADGFAEVLSQADEVILLPIYPARELPMPGVTSELIREKMNPAQARILEKQELLEYLKCIHDGMVIMAGAGDIDTLVQPAKMILNKK